MDAERLPGAARRTLIEVARRTLEEHLRGRPHPPAPDEPAAIHAKRASFVTLWDDPTGGLRGCRGEAFPERALVASVARMAVAAATDPRFEPVVAAELESLSIEISALTPPRPIEPEEVVVGRHGLVLALDGRRGLLLPQVPTHAGWGLEEFLAGLCAKAGLPVGAECEADAELLAFEAEVWGEADPGDGPDSQTSPR